MKHSHRCLVLDNGIWSYKWATTGKTHCNLILSPTCSCPFSLASKVFHLVTALLVGLSTGPLRGRFGGVPCVTSNNCSCCIQQGTNCLIIAYCIADDQLTNILVVLPNYLHFLHCTNTQLLSTSFWQFTMKHSYLYQAFFDIVQICY